MALLESAVAAPHAGIGGRSLYRDIPEVAAACLFYICKNHPFIDGNKCTGFGACLVFLRLNDYDPQADGREWEELTKGIAANRMDREQATERLRHLLRS